MTNNDNNSIVHDTLKGKKKRKKKTPLNSKMHPLVYTDM